MSGIKLNSAGGGSVTLQPETTGVDVTLNVPADNSTLMSAAELAAGTGASLVGYTPAGTGAVATTVQEALRRTVSVFDFLPATQIAYIKANNTASQDAAVVTAAIHEAMAFVPDGTVLFPNGTYLVTGIHQPQGCKIVGQSREATILKASPSATYVIRNALSADYDQYDLGIANLSIQGNTTCNGIELLRPWYGIFDNLRVYDCNYGFYVYQAIFCSFSNLVVTGNTVGFRLNSGIASWANQTANALPSTHNEFRNSTFISNTSEGLYINGVSGAQFTDCGFEANNTSGANNVTIKNSATYSNTVAMAVFKGCWFESNSDYLAYVDGSDNAISAVFECCRFATNGSGSAQTIRAVYSYSGTVVIIYPLVYDYGAVSGGSTAVFRVNKAQVGKLNYIGQRIATAVGDTTTGFVDDENGNKTGLNGYVSVLAQDGFGDYRYGRTVYFTDTSVSAIDLHIASGGAWEAKPRVSLQYNGLYFGDGTNNADAQIYRYDANVLKTGSGDDLMVDGGWNTGKLRLGSYYLWVDSSGRLRIKQFAPGSDTDGTVVGTQT